MKNLYFSLFAILLACTSVSAQKNSYTDLLFYESNAHKITQEHVKTIDSLLTRYFSYSDYQVDIIGHADSQGSKDYNEKIAERRAEAVMNYLVMAGIPQEKIHISSKGSSIPLDDSRLKGINGSNRRVELISTAKGYASVDDLLDKLGPEKQIHRIDNSEDQSITLMDGTEIFVPANSLVYADGSGLIKGQATIEFKESFDVMDFVTEDLHTTTDKGLLQTGGMIYLNAKSNGKQLGIKKGEKIDIKYPQKTVAADMGLYAAIEKPEGTSWELTKGNIGYESQQIEEFDLSVILEKSLKSPVMPRISFETRMPKIPVIPAKPQKPTKPVDPKGNGALQARYSKSIKLYERQMANYEDMVLNYDTVKPRAESELRMWELEVESRMTQIKEYEKEMKDFYCDTKLNDAIEYVQSNYGAIPSDQLYASFKKMVYTEAELENIVDPYEKAFGKFKKQVIRKKNIRDNYKDYNSYGRKSKFHREVKPLIDAIEQQRMEDAMASQNGINDSDLDRYMFSVGSFGYHNVDKPIDYAPEEVLELAINDGAADTKYFVVLKNAQSMVSPQFADGSYSLEGLPKNHDVKIIGVKLVDASPQMAVIDTNTGNDSMFSLDMNFERTNLDGIRTELESLNAYAGI